MQDADLRGGVGEGGYGCAVKVLLCDQFLI